jgi:hypothetical protein
MFRRTSKTQRSPCHTFRGANAPREASQSRHEARFTLGVLLTIRTRLARCRLGQTKFVFARCSHDGASDGWGARNGLQIH